MWAVNLGIESYREFNGEQKKMDSSNEIELLQKAELLMELRGYKKEGVEQTETAIDIKASMQDSDETVLIHIIKANSIGEKIKNFDYNLEEGKTYKIIVLGTLFTKAAHKHLRAQDIEFFPANRPIGSSLNLQELYLKIRNSVDILCEEKCGHVPQSESECEGFSKSFNECSYCSGKGNLEYFYKARACPICGGTGSTQSQYPCNIRLISDNSDFHFKKSWIDLLRNDLLSLITLRISKLQTASQFQQV